MDGVVEMRTTIGNRVAQSYEGSQSQKIGILFFNKQCDLSVTIPILVVRRAG
ncbi:hypothetical protein OnM2_000029 [Erysiphe neolycopersici]|uniref:Uncharacterized protein n=1 Tax=Erysiphe neolycopersici TaxID=212602 RepID=A0A420I8H2_9PEZI|nr:hypothetical protein OnM2_000029 [Erysiphe neolycopersici]